MFKLEKQQTSLPSKTNTTFGKDIDSSGFTRGRKVRDMAAQTLEGIKEFTIELIELILIELLQML
ncbi:hypothetical protein [Aureibacter tunicatorum]|uniref:Uncharacterized protein n=1 Tax=Aureibacter tunicatorum TaxID=866807 RepID=A0AAE3XTP6_9BACT|nr:hypothetical protein [Aureibacter tunicatorum]MDR6241799.1 hypothetical protein [Aureibacter tunicatorum]